MRILFITETIPYPLDSGGRIKTYHTLQILAGVHRVRLHAFIRDEAQRASEPALTALGVETALHLLPRSPAREAWLAARSLGGAPYTVGRHFDRAVHAQLVREVADSRPDLVYCDHLSMAEYAGRLGVPVVYDAHNVEHALVRRYAETRTGLPVRLAGAIEWRRVRRYEAEVCRRSRLVLVVSDVDRRALAALAGPAARFATVPIAVDASGLPAVKRLTESPQVLFLGGLHWPPNADALATFVRESWPAVLAGRPDATLVSVGRADHPVAVECRAAPSVTLTGHVPDIDPYVQQSRVLVVPMRAGSGMRVKILDAMARGVPVVTTSVGCEGIDVVSGRHVLVADDPNAFAVAVLRVLNDARLAADLAAAARTLVTSRYDVPVVKVRLLDGLAAAVGRDAQPGT